MAWAKTTLVLTIYCSAHVAASLNDPLRSGTCSVPPVSDEDFDCFLQAQKSILLSSRKEHSKILSTLAEQESRINVLTTRFQTVLERLDSVQNELSSLKSSTSEKNRVENGQVDSLTTAVGQLNSRLEQIDNKANQAINGYQNCLVNVGFTPLEASAIWRGSGYTDTPGYVIVGVDNFNHDNFADNAFRRRIQIQKGNGAWQEVIWN